jgi:hypothetical protein
VPSFLFSDDIADGFVPANTCRCWAPWEDWLAAAASRAREARFQL